MKFNFTEKSREYIEKQVKDRDEVGLFIYMVIHRG